MKKSSSEKTLLKALSLVQKGWTKGAYARNAKGDACAPTSSRAVRFCALGALDRAAGASKAEFSRAKELLRICANNIILIDWNDRGTKAQVIRAFKAAIKLERTIRLARRRNAS